MPKRTNEFQSLIKTIYQQVVADGGTVEESAMVFDRDAEIQREVDVLITYRQAGHGLTVCVECRDRTNRESLPWIDELIGKTRSLDVNKVVAVSSKGFSEAALRKAHKNRIETLTLREAQETDWGNFPIKLGLAFLTEPMYRLVDVLYKHNDTFLPMSNLGFESEIEYKGEVIGPLFEPIISLFSEKLCPALERYVNERKMEIFQNKADLEKDLLIEVERDLPRIIVLSLAGGRVGIERVKFVVIRTQKLKNIELKHQVFNHMAVSTGKYFADDSIIEVTIVQDPETMKAHLSTHRVEEKKQ